MILVAIAGVAGALAVGALKNERDFDRLIAAGDAAVLAERPYQASEAYSGAIALKPDSMLAHYKRGAVYQSLNEQENALRDFRSAADIDPTSLRALESLGAQQPGRAPPAEHPCRTTARRERVDSSQRSPPARWGQSSDWRRVLAESAR